MSKVIETSVVDAASSVASTVNKVSATYGHILQGYLIKALEKTGNVIDKSVDMVMEQAPLLVQEVLHWYFAYNLIQFIVGLVIVIIVVVFWYKQFAWGVTQSKLERKLQSDYYTDADGQVVRYILNAIMFIPLIIGFVMMNLEWLKIYIAPRLWLIEYTANLVKPVTGHH